MSEPISTRQAKVLVDAALGYETTISRINRILRELAARRRLSDEWHANGLLTPGDVDRLVGELWRYRAGWYQKRNVNGDVEAWVLDAGETWRVLMLPYERTWDNEAKAEVATLAETIPCYEWPTGALTGYLVHKGERYGLPAYEWHSSSRPDEEVAEVRSH